MHIVFCFEQIAHMDMYSWWNYSMYFTEARWLMLWRMNVIGLEWNDLDSFNVVMWNFKETFFIRQSHQAQHRFIGRRLWIGENEDTGDMSIHHKTMTFPWYMANQNKFREIVEKFGISDSITVQCVVEVTSGLLNLSPQVITWPNNCQKHCRNLVFRRLGGKYDAIGAIDVGHTQKQKPRNNNSFMYIKRKGYYPIILQAVCDEGRSKSIVTGAPGSVHDARLLRMCDFSN